MTDFQSIHRIYIYISLLFNSRYTYLICYWDIHSSYTNGFSNANWKLFWPPKLHIWLSFHFVGVYYIIMTAATVAWACTVVNRYHFLANATRAFRFVLRSRFQKVVDTTVQTVFAIDYSDIYRTLSVGKRQRVRPE